jgi:1,2-phenylacetyl-CoA epoxidase PaaB subunit
MADMWKVVIETARRLNIQVFATTHSLDCVRALAWVQESTVDRAEDVSLHRVESSSELTANYTLDEVATAARHHVEVR